MKNMLCWEEVSGFFREGEGVCGCVLWDYFFLLLVMGARRNSVAVAIAKKHAPSHLKVCETS